MSDTEIGRKMGIRVTEFFPVFSNARSAYVFGPAEWAVEKNHSVCCTLKIEFAIHFKLLVFILTQQKHMTDASTAHAAI